MKLPVGYVPGQGVRKATAYGGLGQKLLEQMGWKKGDGLGRNADGISSAIEVKEKHDTTGLGAKADNWDWTNAYWDKAYAAAVPSAKEDKSSGSSSDTSVQSSASDSSSDDSDDDDDDAACARRAALAAAVVNADGTVSTASQAELKIAAELAKDPWGRWGGRRGKLARIREQEAAAAAAFGLQLHVAPSGKEALATSKSKKRKAAQSSDTDTTAAVAHPKARKQKKVSKQASTVSAKVPNTADDSACTLATPTTTADVTANGTGNGTMQIVEGDGVPCAAAYERDGWWGAKRFVFAGVLGGISEVKVDNKRKEFTEDTQAALYSDVQRLQRQGMRGVGSAAANMGRDWKGSKTKFDSDVSDSEASCDDAQQIACDNDNDVVDANGCSGAVTHDDNAAAATQQQKPRGKVQWNRVIKSVFKQMGVQKLSLKRLTAAVARCEDVAALQLSHVQLRQRLLRKVEKSARFTQDGKHICFV